MILIKLIFILAGIASIIFGAHGLVVYFHPVEALFKGMQKLFLEFDVPSGVQSWVEWMSIKGLQSWFMPALFIAIGVGLWMLQGKLRSR